MRTRVASLVGGLFVALLVGASFAGASVPFKRYALPAAPPGKIASTQVLSVSLPSGWLVNPEWPPSATDPRHPGVTWSMNASFESIGTTLADIRKRNSWTGCRRGWGYETQVADSYVALPIGRVWHSTMRLYKDKACTLAIGDIHRYWLDRKAISLTGREAFLWFGAECRTNQCRMANQQFVAIVHSIRWITP